MVTFYVVPLCVIPSVSAAGVAGDDRADDSLGLGTADLRKVGAASFLEPDADNLREDETDPGFGAGDLYFFLWFSWCNYRFRHDEHLRRFFTEKEKYMVIHH